MCAGFTWARNSGCNVLQRGNHFVGKAPLAQILHPSSRVQGRWTSLSKNRTKFWTVSCPYGADAEIRVPPIAVAGDDAAADAGDQAAAAVQSRPLGLCRGRAGAQSAARARQ